jgi:hypothetical protein
MKKYLTTKEQIIEILTGITIEQWEENNKWLEEYFKNLKSYSSKVEPALYKC